MQCSFCKHENPADSFTCEKCGSLLSSAFESTSVGLSQSELDDVLGFGSSGNEIEIGQATQVLEDLPAAPPKGPEGSISVLLRINGQEQSIFIMPGEEVFLGRDDPDDESVSSVDLSSFDAHGAGVSRQHAILIYDHGLLMLDDLHSRNGTWLNGDVVWPELSRVLSPGDVIHLAGLEVEIDFTLPQTAEREVAERERKEKEKKQRRKRGLFPRN